MIFVIIFISVKQEQLMNGKQVMKARPCPSEPHKGGWGVSPAKLVPTKVGTCAREARACAGR